MTAAVEETGLGQAAGKAATLVRDSVKTVIAASMVGTAIEFYDFYAYGTAAANYFPHIFFSAKDNPTVALLMSLLTFAVAFIARPLGSLIFGHFGDRMGRKTTLVVSLMTMGVGTFLIGCLPTYDQVGVGAVAILCLLRFIQGIGLGGEWSGAALVATENAPEDKRALYGSFPELGAPIGFFLSNGTFFLLEAFNDSEAMMTWGWRVPFLLAGPLGLIVLYIRAKLADSPVYQSMNDALESKGAASADGQIAAKSGMFAPLAELFHNHLKALIISFGACVLNAVGFYTVLTYLPTYLSDTVGMDAPQSGTITTICLVAYVFMVFGMGHISDKFGRKKVLIGACVAFIVLTVPAFLILNTSQFWPVLLVELAMCATLTANDGTLSSYLTETFPTSVRFTGFAFSFNLANAIFGGTASFIATGLIALTGSSIAPAWYMVGVAAIALVAMILSHENTDKDLNHI